MEMMRDCEDLTSRQWQAFKHQIWSDSAPLCNHLWVLKRFHALHQFQLMLPLYQAHNAHLLA